MENLTYSGFLTAFLLTLIAGLSTSIGAVLAFFSRSKNYFVLSLGLGFSAGVMIYVSFMDIIPSSKDAFTQMYSNPLYGEVLSVACFFLGIAISAVIDKYIPDDVNPHEPKKDFEYQELKDEHSPEQHANFALKRTGLFTAIAIGIHNFPEGFATFIAAFHDITIGIPIALAIAIHNIPEGMSVSLPIYHATGDRKKAFWYATLSGLAEPIGGLVGFFIIFPILGEVTLGITFGVVAGIMVYISFDELLPASRVYGNAHTAIIGITLGMFVMALSLISFKLI